MDFTKPRKKRKFKIKLSGEGTYFEDTPERTFNEAIKDFFGKSGADLTKDYGSKPVIEAFLNYLNAQGKLKTKSSIWVESFDSFGNAVDPDDEIGYED